MWISRKRYEDLENKVKALCEAHSIRAKAEYFYDGVDVLIENGYICDHDTVNLNNAEVNSENYSIKLHEIAKYVVDSKPIIRQKETDIEITPKCKTKRKSGNGNKL